MIYNINENKFINKDYKIQLCSLNKGAIHTYYFPKNDQFAASCISYNKDYSLLIINGDFSNATLFKEHLGDSCYGIYSFSIIPSISDGEYSILLESNCDSGIYIRQYIITENEENCIEYRDEPIDLSLSTEFISTSIKEIFLTYEPITEDTSVEEVDKCILQKCLKCDNESISQNKCITCNFGKNYYPIKSEFILQKNGNEYIDCYNENTRPSNFCFNIKDYYYEKCFESCYILYNCSSRIFLDNNLENDNNDNYIDYIFQNCNNSLLYNIANKTTISNINDIFNIKNNSCLNVGEKKVCFINCSDDNEINKKCYENFSYEEYNSFFNIFLCTQNTYKIYGDIDSFYSFLENNENSKDNILESIRNELINGNLNLLIDNIVKKDKKNIIYKDNNLIYELTSTDIKNHDNNISNINLGICENKLKISNDINIDDPLIILKVEIHEEGMLVPVIEYEVYNFKSKDKLNLNICKNDKVDISIPVNINENDLYKHNISNDYYNDKCYIADSKIDIILNDRRNEYYINNMSVCEKDCIFKDYNFYTKKVLCECFIKINFPLISEIGYNKDKFINDFKNISNIINLDIIKCYKSLFTKKGLIKNIGNYVLISIIIINIILFLLFKIKGFKKLKKQIENITKIKEKIKKKKKKGKKKQKNNPPKIKIKNKRKKIVL